MKPTNQLTRFLAMVISIVLFFILAGLGKLCGQTNTQNPKDFLGYSLHFNNSADKDKFYLVYSSLIYDSTNLLNTPKTVTLVLDTFYVKLVNTSKESTLNLGTLLMEQLLKQTYRYSNGKAIFLYSYSKEVRSQENWPGLEWKVSNIYGEMIGNTAYILEEITQEPLRKGWTGPIITFCFIGMVFVLLIIVQYFASIAYWNSLGAAYWFITFLIFVLLLMPFLWTSEGTDKFGAILYLKIALGIIVLDLLLIKLYLILLKKHNKKLGLN